MALIHVCYEYLFEKSRGIAGSSVLAFFIFHLYIFAFLCGTKQRFQGMFWNVTKLLNQKSPHIIIENAFEKLLHQNNSKQVPQLNLSAGSGCSDMFSI